MARESKLIHSWPNKYYNSTRSKYDILTSIISDNIDVLLLSETKIYLLIPNDQRF